MLALAWILVLVQCRAVERREAVRVLGKMARHPVENHAESRLMTRIDQELEILRRAEPTRRREETDHLIAPGAGEGMLHYREQLDVREAQVFDVGHEARCQLAIGEKPVAVFRHPRPRPEVHLVHRHGPVEPCALRRP